MSYGITVWTEDGEEYELNETFKTREEALEELDDILSGSKYLEGSRITEGCVGRN